MTNKKQAKILIIDIETAPTIAYVWQAWKANVGINQIKENGYIMSFSAKWLGDDFIYYEENRDGNDKAIVKNMIDLFEAADIVVAHNAKKFDIPTVMGRAAVHKIAPPSPFKIIDTLLVARKEFRMFRNNLAYIAEVFGCAPKLKHGAFPGFELWLQCLKQNDAAWAEMQEYNIQDVLTLEEVYLHMRPYMKNHPNVGVYLEDSRPLCPACGTHHIHWRGYYHSNVAKYRRFRCTECGYWGRSRQTEYPKDKRKVLTSNAL